MLKIADLDHEGSTQLLSATPSLATATITRDEEFFLAARLTQVYDGDTALHAAAFSYDVIMAGEMISRGADIRAGNRRGAEPLHAATVGVPGSSGWNPARQSEVITYLVAAGADPDARATGGVTPLHRAVRNRCSAAVASLLEGGADPECRNDDGSTAYDLAGQATGRGGTGSPDAKLEQQVIIELLRKSK